MQEVQQLIVKRDIETLEEAINVLESIAQSSANARYDGIICRAKADVMLCLRLIRNGVVVTKSQTITM